MPAGDTGLWARHLSAWRAFEVVCTQWRTVAGMNGIRFLGLDYSAARAGLELAGIAVSPATWADVRDIEQGALAGLNRSLS